MKKLLSKEISSCKSNEEGKDQELIQLSTTPARPRIPYHGKVTKTQENIIYQRAPRDQCFPSGEHKASRNRQDRMTKTIMKHK